MFSAICNQPRNNNCKYFAWFYFSFLEYVLLCLSSSMLSTSDCRCKGSMFESHQKFFKLQLNVCLYITHVCSFVLYSGLWVSGLSSVLLRKKYWSMLKAVGSNPATGTNSSTFILSIQIRNFPTPLRYHMYVQLPHLVKSAVLPKTTCLCSSITVIPLWVECMSNVYKYVLETHFSLFQCTRIGKIISLIFSRDESINFAKI